MNKATNSSGTQTEKPSSETLDYVSPVKIVNIRHGKGYRSKYIYCELRDAEDRLLISATLDDIKIRLDQYI